MKKNWDRVAAQAERLGRLGRSLNDEQWNAQSLCSEWRVRDVFGHMTQGATFPLRKMLGQVVRHRGNVDRAAAVGARALGEDLSQDELLTKWEAAANNPKGLAKVIPADVLFADLNVHELDLRRPLGIDDPQPPDVQATILDLMMTTGSPGMPSSKRAKGLSFRATDIEWSRTIEGAPSVEGPAEDLMLAIAGREIGYRSLTGDGVATLAERTGVRSASPSRA